MLEALVDRWPVAPQGFDLWKFDLQRLGLQRLDPQRLDPPIVSYFVPSHLALPPPVLSYPAIHYPVQWEPVYLKLASELRSDHAVQQDWGSLPEQVPGPTQRPPHPIFCFGALSSGYQASLPTNSNGPT